MAHQDGQQLIIKIAALPPHMSLKSLHQVLNTLENQAGWEARKQFQHLLRSWETVVGQVVAAQTRPISLQWGVLRVATSSSAWAQNLMFERQRILEKLNAQLSAPLVDIRFSTAHWQQRALNQTNTVELSSLWQEHPSYVPGLTGPQAEQSKQGQAVEDKSNPEVAFQQWAREVRLRSQRLPLCPRCQCHTPPGELQRWGVCALCAPHQW